MLTQQTVAILGALAGAIHGAISSILYFGRDEQAEQKWVGHIVAPIATLLWSMLGFGAARGFIRPTLGALLGATLGVVVPSLFVLAKQWRSQVPKYQCILCAVNVSALGLVVGATYGTAPRESLSGAVVGLVIGIVIALVLMLSGLHTRWSVPSAAEHKGWLGGLINMVYLAVGGASLGAILAVVLDSKRVLVGLFFP